MPDIAQLVLQQKLGNTGAVPTAPRSWDFAYQWNSAVTMDGAYVNYTDTLSNTDSRVLSIAINGVLKVGFRKDGMLTTGDVAFTQAGTGAVERGLKARAAYVVSVLDFGAVGNGVTDDHQAFVNAIAYAGSLGGGVVLVPSKIYYFGTSATLVIPKNVTLKGDAVGPFDGNANPATTVFGPTLLVTNTVTGFITLNDYSAKCEDLIFYYPNQVAVTAATPTVYPYTVTMAQGRGSQFLKRCTIVNAYNGVSIQSGRTGVIDCLIGAFNNDILIDEAQDWVDVSGTRCQVMWDVFAGVSYPQTIDTWVLNNSIALRTRRVDSLFGIGFGVFSRYRGHLSEDSGNVALSPRCGYGQLINVDFDYVAFGVTSQSSTAAAHGFKYTNINIGANASGVGTAGQAAFITLAGGIEAPVITATCGHIRGTWAASTGYQNNAGKIYTKEIRGINPAGALTAPAVPATTVAATNTFPFPVRVFIAGGTFTNVTINGSGAGAAQGLYLLEPYDTIAITYTVAPTWAWFGC